MTTPNVDEFFGPTFWVDVAAMMEQGQRKGQAVYNLAHSMYPKEVSRMNGHALDPFYDNRKISSFMEKVIDLHTGGTL